MDFLPPPPPGFNYIAVIQPSLQDIFIAHSFTVLQVILLGCLLFFSRSTTRSKAVFQLNVLTLVLAIILGILLEYQAATVMLSPEKEIPLSFNVATGALDIVQYILVDTTLFVRLISVYPRSYIGTTKFLMLIALPVLLKILRVVNLIVYVALLTRDEHNPVKYAMWASAPFLKIEWLSAVVDNAYVSIFFLWTLWHRRKAHDASGVTSFGKGSLSRRLATIFWMAFSTFALPFLFSVAQVIVIFLPAGAVPNAVIEQILLVNTSLAVCGVVFATVWAESRAWTNTHGSESGGVGTSSYGVRVSQSVIVSSDEKGRFTRALRNMKSQQQHDLELQQLDVHRPAVGQAVSATSDKNSAAHTLEWKTAAFDAESTESVIGAKLHVDDDI